MPNIFPKRKLHDNDVLDPNDMNEDLQPIQGVVAGNLDMENIAGISADSTGKNFKSAGIPDKQAYYKLHSAAGQYVPPDFLDGRNLDPGARGVQHPTFDPDNPAEGIFVVPETNQWTAIDKLDVEITTGASNLWINSIVQYCRNGWSFNTAPLTIDREVEVDGTKSPSQLGLHHSSNGFYPARIQFAIRINGRVIEWTVTGKHDLYESDSIGIRPAESLVRDKKRLPGITVPNSRIVAPGPEMLPIRLGTFFPVEPGTYKVEVVARRVPTRKRQGSLNEDVIGIFSRELHVLELPVHSTQSEVFTVTSSDSAFQLRGESLLNSVGAQVSAAYDQCNNLFEGNIKREALVHQQLPSKVVSAIQSTLTFDELSGPTYSREATHWPGENSTTVTEASGGWGWYQLRNLKDGRLQVETTATFRDDDIIILMANVALKALKPRGGTVPERNYQRFLDMFGAFRFGIRDNATSSGIEDWRISRVTGPGNAVYVNSFNWCSLIAGFSNASSTDTTESIEDYFGVESDEYVDIPLFTILRGSNFTSAATRHWIGVFGASMSAVKGGPGTGPHYGSGTTTLRNPEYQWKGSNLIMIHLRK